MTDNNVMELQIGNSHHHFTKFGSGLL